MDNCLKIIAQKQLNEKIEALTAEAAIDLIVVLRYAMDNYKRRLLEKGSGEEYTFTSAGEAIEAFYAHIVVELPADPSVIHNAINKLDSELYGGGIGQTKNHD